MEPGLVIVLIVGALVFIRLVAGGMGHARVERYVRSLGGRALRQRWNPLGTGWFGEQNARIYEVRYVDGEKNVHEATCKTSMFAGVYFTEDRIVSEEPAPQDDLEMESLREENRRLREELERMRREQG